MRRHFGLCCLFAALLLQASAVGAAQYSLLATGTIASLEEDDLDFDGSISIGTPFSVSLTFDTDAVAPETPGYYSFTLPHSMNAFVGDYAFASGAPGFQISVVPAADEYDNDRVALLAFNPISLGNPPPGAGEYDLYIELRSLTQGVLASPALDPAIFDLALWDEVEFTYYSCKCGGSASAFGLVDTLTLTPIPIPEPSSGALLLGGLVALARRRAGETS